MATEFLQVSNIPANGVRDLFVDADTGEADSRDIGDRPARITVAIQADAVGIEFDIRSGLRTAVPRSTLDAGGTLGVFPNINETAFSFLAAPREKLRGSLRETAGVATTDVMATVDITPL